ncbi:MAG: uroporphyrinogen-III synthase [Gemmataceae bacterium]
MPRPLEGKTVALAEGRQLEELVALLEREGAVTLRYPLLSILDAPDPAPVLDWLALLIADRFHRVILMTGEALRRLAGFAERAGLHEQFVAALSADALSCAADRSLASRLRELGLQPTETAPAPTTQGVLTALSTVDLDGKTVGITLYGSPNPTLTEFLTQRGATVVPVMPYVLAPAADDDRVADLIHRLEGGTVDVLVFTSSPQVDRAWEVAEKMHLLPSLQAGLERTRIAAVGPLVADALRQRGASVAICPQQGWQMKNLVRQIARALES